MPGHAASVLYARELLVLTGFLMVLNWKKLLFRGLLGTVSRAIDGRARHRAAVAHAQASRGMDPTVSLYRIYCNHGGHVAPRIIMNYR